MIIGYEQWGSLSDFYNMTKANEQEKSFHNYSTYVSNEKYYNEETNNSGKNVSNTNQQNNKSLQNHFLFVRKEHNDIKEKVNNKKKDCLIRVYYSSDEEDDTSQITQAIYPMYDNKRDNIVQITIKGISTFNEKYRSLELKEHFQNPIDNYAYNVHTYVVQSQQFQNYAISTIELHDNLLRKGTLDKEQFYSNVSYINKIRDYFVYSESFVKYLSNASVNCKIGKALIVEFARCDQNMGALLKSLGYQEKEMILKKGHIIRYRNYPIIAITSDKYEELEVVGYCEESNKSKLEEIMINIKTQLSQSYNFEDKSK